MWPADGVEQDGGAVRQQRFTRFGEHVDLRASEPC
jgi:hypothetical protein